MCRCYHAQTFRVPNLIFVSEDDQVVSVNEIRKFSEQTQGTTRMFVYPHKRGVYHDNIQRYRKNLEIGDPLAWEKTL